MEFKQNNNKHYLTALLLLLIQVFSAYTAPVVSSSVNKRSMIYPCILYNYVFFEKPSHWGDTVYVYSYSDHPDNPFNSISWPGESAFNVKDNIYISYFSHDITKYDTYIIFTDGENQIPGKLARGFELVEGGYYTEKGIQSVCNDYLNRTAKNYDGNYFDDECGDYVKINYNVPEDNKLTDGVKAKYQIDNGPWKEAILRKSKEYDYHGYFNLEGGKEIKFAFSSGELYDDNYGQYFKARFLHQNNFVSNFDFTSITNTTTTTTTTTIAPSTSASTIAITTPVTITATVTVTTKATSSPTTTTTSTSTSTHNPHYVGSFELCKDVFFEKPSHWGNKIYGYVYSSHTYRSNKEYLVPWPGKPFKLEDENSNNNLYTECILIDYFENDDSYIIFTDGTHQVPGVNQTGFKLIPYAYYTEKGLQSICPYNKGKLVSDGDRPCGNYVQLYYEANDKWFHNTIKAHYKIGNGEWTKTPVKMDNYQLNSFYLSIDVGNDHEVTVAFTDGDQWDNNHGENFKAYSKEFKKLTSTI